MIITLCQAEVIPGRPSENIRTMTSMIQGARDLGAQVVVFPELCVSGYLLGDLWTDGTFTQELMDMNHEIRALSKDCTLVWGNIYLDPSRSNKDGRTRLYNSVHIAQNGAYIERTTCPLPPGVSHKTLLPNYRIFDDSRYFFSLVDLANEEGRPLEDYLIPFPMTHGDSTLSLGLEICEDLWFHDYSYKHQRLNPTAYFEDAGAELIINVSSSPWTHGKNQARHRRVKEAMAGGTKAQAKAFFYVNCTGVQNNGKNMVTFDGGSSVYNSQGDLVANLEEAYKSDLLSVDFSTIDSLGILEPNPAQEGRAKARAQIKAAVRAIKSLDTLLGNSQWPMIIGVSGGIDSAVSTCLVEQALGPQRLRLFNLPSSYNSEATKGVAQHLASSLGVELESLPINDLVAANRTILEAYQPSILNQENIQAKVRGTSILSNLAGILGGLMCNNGNKVELALGYATLYGDVNGAIAPLGDLLKVEVCEIARVLNEEVYARVVIPQEIILGEDFTCPIPPSAELKPNQVDPMKWGYHDAILSRIMTYRRSSMADIAGWWLQGSLAEELRLPASLLERHGLFQGEVFVKDLEWFFRLMDLGVFKRIQAPPVVIMSRSSFGYDWRESQIRREAGQTWLSLRETILNGAPYGSQGLPKVEASVPG